MLLINGIFLGSCYSFWAVFRLNIFVKFLRWAVVFPYFLSCECKTGTQTLNLIVIEDIARFRSSTASAKWYSRLAWIIHQLLHVSLCVYNRSLNLVIFLLSLILSDDKKQNLHLFANTTTAQPSPRTNSSSSTPRCLLTTPLWVLIDYIPPLPKY